MVQTVFNSRIKCHFYALIVLQVIKRNLKVDIDLIRRFAVARFGLLISLPGQGSDTDGILGNA